MYYLTDDASYWYEVHGEGIPVVLLHGFTGSTSTWNNYIITHGEDLQIITIDLPGHGKTKTTGPKTMEACCQDLNELFQFLNLDTFHLLGYSMGGRTALSYAMLYPESIQSLILESASPGLATKEARESRVDKDGLLAKRIEQDGLYSFVNLWENIPLFQTQKKLPDEIQLAIREERLAQTEQGLADSLKYMGTGSQPSWWNELGHFKKPVLLLAGARDEKFVDINKKMKNSLEISELIIVDDAGHAIHVEKPAIFGKLVRTFIRKGSNTNF